MRRWSVLALLFVAFVAEGTLFGQVTGSISGSVVDASGAAIPGALVSLQMPGGKAAVFSTKTTASGDFTILSIPSGTYDLAVDVSGFVKGVVSGLAVNPNRALDVPTIKLEVAGLRQTVEVVVGAEQVQSSNAEVTSTITQSQIANLPVLDRSPLAFIYSQAGVNYGRGATSINGQKSTFTNVTLDGINIQDNFIRTNDMDFLPNMLLLDQVAEVSISTSNASAANYGGSAQVSFVTPSGANMFHGNAYWSNRNNYLRANTFFNNQSGTPVPKMNLNQIGGSIGGRLIRDKAFFYTNYEAYRQRQQSSRNYTILTSTARSGITTYKDTSGVVRQVNILQAMGWSLDPTMNKYLALVPDASNINNYDVGDSTAALLRNTAGYRVNRRNNRTRDNFTLKGDYLLSTNNSFTATYAPNRDIVDRPDQDPTYSIVPLQSNNGTTKLLSVAWRYNPKPTMTNEVRFGFNWAPAVFLDEQTIPTYFITGTTYTSPVAGVLRTQGRNTDTYNFADNASWVHGAHTFQFGYQQQDVRIEQYNDAGITPSYSLGLGLNTPGLTSTQMPGSSSTDRSAANTLMATLAGLYSGYSQTFNVSSRTSGYVQNYANVRHNTQNNYALYVQDNWKVNRRLTATLGMRWDYYPPTDERDALALFPVLNGNVIQTMLSPTGTLDFAGSVVGRPWWNPNKKIFAPNIGLAFDPTGGGKWVIRAGYSLSYVNDSIVTSANNSQLSNSGLSTGVSAPTSLDGRFAAGVVAVPTPVFKVPRTFADNFALNPSGNALAMPGPDLQTPYVQQWNVGVQRSIKNTLLEIRYVGNHATKQVRGFDYNQVLIDQILPAFKIAANNGWLAQAANGTFAAAYNPSIAGSQPTTFFNAMPNGGYLTNSSVVTYLQQGAVGELANFYQTNQVNGPYNFYINTSALGCNVLTNYSSSSYNGLQVEATQRLSRGLQFQASYVFSKVLSDADGSGQTNFEAFLDMKNAKLERRRVSAYDLTHQIKANYYYQFPFGKGHALNFNNPVASKVISGWNMSGIWSLQSGAPFSVLSGRGTLNRNARSAGNTASTSLTKDQLDPLLQFYKDGNGVWFFPQANKNPADGRAVAPDGAAAFTGQVFFQPGAGTLGQLQRNMFSGPWVWNLDFHMAKVTNISERVTAELRMDAQNIFNHSTWSIGDMTLTSTTFGKVTSNFYMQRALQFALYLRF